ncbi:uncharacterized protein LOC127806630 isoform X2 [Diospyros lotus]|nr:uncharacterized protein LOC127806630 isoform X2 [Diospyros lotus]
MNSREDRVASNQKDSRSSTWEDGEARNGPGRLPSTGDQRSVTHMLVENSLIQLVSRDTSEQIHLNDQTGNVDGLGTGRILERENLLGSIGRKPSKWTRSGSLSSRCSVFSYASSFKSMGMDSSEAKAEVQPKRVTPIWSPSGDAMACSALAVPSEETNARKKLRLNWGEGLAKYEKKKVEASDDRATNPGMIVCGNTDPMHSHLSNLSEKSPRVAGTSDCRSPTIPSPIACSSSPGGEETPFVREVNILGDAINLNSSTGLLSQSHVEGIAFNLESLKLSPIPNLSTSLCEFFQSEELEDSSFVRSTPMNKLLLWKGDILKELEVTESEIELLENEFKCLISKNENRCQCPAGSSSLQQECQTKPCEKLVVNSNAIPQPAPLQLASSEGVAVDDGGGLKKEHGQVEDHHMDSPGIVISKSAENTTTLSKSMKHDEVASKSRNQEEKCSVGDSNEEKTEGLLTSEGGGQLTFSKTSVACDLILASNKDCASRASQEFNKLLPFVDYHIDTSRTTNVSWQKDPHVKGKFVMRKHLLKFKERIMTLRYRAFQHLWKEDLRLLSIRKHHAKSQKRLELSSHTPHTGYPKYWLPARSRLSSPDTQAEPYRSYLKMPLLILDKKEKMSSRFISSNGLVEDPCSLEKERAMINPWTAKEKEIFLDKLANFGKDFKKIASFLHHKTTADCVEFYYKNHKLDCFVKTKKSQLAKQGKSCSRNNYLIASGKRWNHETNTASLAMLGMASAMASNADHGMKKQQKCTVRLKVRATSNHSALRGGNDMLERSSSVDILNSEREAVAADVLAGICSSLSSEAMSSCITSSFDPAESYHDQKSQVVGSLKRQRPFTPEVTQNADDVTCSDESCGEMEHTDWTDEEKAVFIQAVSSYGKDFATISRSVRTRSRNQCKIFFSKARKCLELDMLCPWPCDQRMLGNEDAKEGGSGNNNICTETNSAICSERTGSKVDENMMPSDLNRKCDPAETVILQTDLMSRSEDNGTEAIDEEHELQSEDMVTGWQGEANQKFDFGTNGEENADFPPSVGGGDEATEETNSVGESVPPKCDEDHGEVLPDAEADTFNVGLELKDQHRISDSNLNDRKAEENGILNASSLSDSKCCDKVLHTNRNVSNLAVETNATLGYQVDLKRKQKDALELKAPLEPRTSLLVSVNSVIECPDLSSDGPPALDFENFRDKECQKLAIGNDNNQHQSGHSLLERGGSWPILQGYPFRVFTNKEMNNGDKDFEELDVQSRNRKLPSDMYLSQEWFLQKCNGLKTNNAVAQIPFQLQEQKSYRSRSPSLNSSDTEKPCRKGDVKLFGQILTKSSAQQNEDEGIQNSKFSSKDCNVKFSTHNVEGNPVPAKLNQNNSCLGYGFWDGNRIQSGFSTASDSSFVLHGRPTSLGNYSNSSNMEWQPLPLGSVVKSNEQNLTSILSNREMSSSNGEADYQLHRSWEIARPNPRTVDVTQRQDTLFPEMRRLSGSDAHPGQLAREMVGDACTGISDPAAINLHYAKTEQYSVKAVGIGSEESWRGEEDGMGRSMERAS